MPKSDHPDDDQAKPIAGEVSTLFGQPQAAKPPFVKLPPMKFFTTRKVFPHEYAEIERQDGATFRITPNHFTEVAPGLRMALDERSTKTTARYIIAAPRSIVISKLEDQDDEDFED